MIPYLLAIAGGYLIGDSMKASKFADGGQLLSDYSNDALTDMVINLRRYEDYNDFSDEINISIENAKENGNDVLIIKNLSDNADYSEYTPATHFLVFDESIIQDKYEDGGLIAPNGKPSNLTAEQYKLVRTPEFNTWFGDWENNPESASKVVDENGEPLVVWHYSDLEFNYFDIKKQIDGKLGKGFYFSKDVDMNSIYGEIKYNCFLCMKNPLKINEFNESPKNQILNKFGGKRDKIKNTLIANKFDGIIWINTFSVFESEQIKLADGSNTTFDSSNPDIRYKEGGLIAPNGKPSNLTPEQYKLVRLIMMVFQ